MICHERPKVFIVDETRNRISALRDDVSDRAVGSDYTSDRATGRRDYLGPRDWQTRLRHEYGGRRATHTFYLNAITTVAGDAYGKAGFAHQWPGSWASE